MRRKVRLLQGSAIQLAVGVDRKRIQVNKEGWQHVLRQRLGKLRVQLVLVQRLFGNIVGADGGLACLVRKVLHRSLRNTSQPPNSRLDFARLHTLTVDLDHPVLAVEIEDIAVRKPSAQIACVNQRLQPVLLPEGIGSEGLGALLRQIQIALSHVSCNTNFTLVTGISRLVQQVHCHALAWSTDGRIVIRLVDRKGQRYSRGFRHAIDVEQTVSIRHKT